MFRQSPSIPNNLVNSLVACLILTLTFSAFSVAMAQAQSSCEAELNQAEQKYRSGELNAALALINRCLGRKETTKQDKMGAYKLLGKIFIAQEKPEEAKKTFMIMLTLNPQMTMDPLQETPEVITIFNEAKTVFEKQPRQPEEPRPAKKGGSKKWLWIGAGGLAAAGTVAILILGGKGEDEGTLVITVEEPTN